MAQQSKREYLESIYLRYRQSSRLEKQRILDEFMRVCGYHRKYAIGLLNRPLPEPRPRRVPTRRPRYSAAVIEVLAELWTASGYLCALRLKAALPTWLPWLRRRLTLSPEQERQLLAISLPDRTALAHPQRAREAARLRHDAAWLAAQAHDSDQNRPVGCDEGRGSGN
jgi:hypothetical protein